MADWDYTVIVAEIAVQEKYCGEEKYTRMFLPAKFTINGWTELQEALRKNNICDNTYHYDAICCDQMKFFLSRAKEKYVETLRHCREDFQVRDHTYFCPFCGKRLRFVYKNLGTFKLGKEKKEVCSYVYKKVE